MGKSVEHHWVAGRLMTVGSKVPQQTMALRQVNSYQCAKMCHEHRVNNRLPSAVGAGELSLLDVSHRGGKLGVAVHNCDLNRLW